MEDRVFNIRVLDFLKPIQTRGNGAWWPIGQSRPSLVGLSLPYCWKFVSSNSSHAIKVNRASFHEIYLTFFRRWRRSRPWRWCKAGDRARSWTSLGWVARFRRCTCPRWRTTQLSRSWRPGKKEILKTLAFSTQSESMRLYQLLTAKLILDVGLLRFSPWKLKFFCPIQAIFRPG